MKETGHGENWDRRGNDTKLDGFWVYPVLILYIPTILLYFITNSYENYLNTLPIA